MPKKTPTAPPDAARSPRRSMSARPWLWFLIFAFYVLLALTRRVDGDEGFFLYAGRLVHEGKLPYRDFFDPHLPTIPFLWTLAFVAPATAWINARLIGAAVATLCAWMFARLLARATAHRGVFGVAMAAYLLGDYGFEWAVPVKTFSLAMTFMLGGWLIGSGPQASRRHWGLAWLASGFLVTLTFGSRIMAAPVTGIVFVFVMLLARESRLPLARAAAWWLAGCAISCLALFAIFAQAPFQSLFGNWYYHFLMPVTLRERAIPNTLTMLDRVFLQPAWLASLFLIARDHLRRRPIGLAGWCHRAIFAELFLTAYIPPQPFHQYYCLATPWLLLAAAPGLEDWWRTAGVPWSRRLARPTRAVLAVAVALALLVEPYRAAERRWPTWTWRPKTAEARDEFNLRLSTIRAIGRRVDELAPPGAKLLSWWPGYALETRVKMVDGLEDQFCLRVSQHVHDPKILARLRVPSKADVDAMIRRHDPPIAVVGIWAGIEHMVGADYYRRMLIENGYVLKDTIGDASIYVAPDWPGRSRAIAPRSK